MKIVIIGAAGQIGQLTARYLLDQTDAELVLFARRAQSRLARFSSDRVTLIDGDHSDVNALTQAMVGADAVLLGFVADDTTFAPVQEAMQAAGVNRVIVLSVPDIYREIEGPFQKWYRANTGLMWQTPIRTLADNLEAGDLDYLILRITWLYNAENKPLNVTRKGEPFTEAQVTREAVAQFITDVLANKLSYSRESLGLGETDTAWEKPSFY